MNSIEATQNRLVGLNAGGRIATQRPGGVAGRRSNGKSRKRCSTVVRVMFSAVVVAWCFTPIQAAEVAKVLDQPMDLNLSGVIKAINFGETAYQAAVLYGSQGQRLCSPHISAGLVSSMSSPLRSPVRMVS